MYRMIDLIFKDPLLTTFIGFIYSTLIAYIFYKKSGRDLKSLENRLNEKNKLKYFEKLLHSSHWQKIANNESIHWVSDKDHTCQIEIINDEKNYDHPWALRNPSESAMVCTVHLTHNNSIIKKLRFLSLDDGRIFIPRPEKDIKSYYLKRDGIEVKTSKIIGRYDHYKNLESVANHYDISII